MFSQLENNSGLNLDRVNAMVRTDALNRLIALLTLGAEVPVQFVANDTDAMSQLARLRSARATYALATSDALVRTGEGAWILRCHIG